MLRSRLGEFYMNTFREDMIMKFGRVVDLRSLECSVIIPKQYSNKDADRYMASSLLEIISGQKTVSQECNPFWEDPMQASLTSEERKEANRARGQLLSESLRSRKNQKTTPKNSTVKISSTEFKKANFATKVKTDLRRVNMFFFLDKLREFYLPEITIGKTVNNHAIYSQFESVGKVMNKSAILSIPPRRQLNTDSLNLREATATYVLKSSDMLKLPDIELHFQSLSCVLKGSEDKASNNDVNMSKKSLDIVLRPTVSWSSPLSTHKKGITEDVNTLKLFNYAMSQFFNPMMNRPIIGKARE